MFLNQLSEKEKRAFLSLSVHASNSNGIFADEEKAMIEEYCKEMKLENFDTEKAEALDEILKIFKEADIHIRKIVLFETLGLLYSDRNFDANEKEFINKFANEMGLSNTDVEQQTVLITEYLELLKKIVEVVA